MMMGPAPMMRMDFMSVRLGIRSDFNLTSSTG